MWKLGNIEIKGKVGLAPMAGITSSGYREFMSKFGADFCYTEMVSDMGLIYNNQETIDYVKFDKLDIPTGVQLFGSNPENLAKAAQIALNFNKNIDFLDVNMACPVPKVNKTGAGASLMKNPQLCGDIIRAIKSVTNLPVTAKIRLGFYDTDLNFIDVINELVNAGVSMVAIHARSAKQLYYGLPNFDILKNIQSKYKIPIFISGNIFSVDDAKKALEITGATGILVARGGEGNPMLLSQLQNYFKNDDISLTPSFKEQVLFCLELAKCMIDEKGEEKAMRIYRGIAPKFFVGYPNCKELRGRLASEMTDFKSLKSILDEYCTFFDSLSI